MALRFVAAQDAEDSMTYYLANDASGLFEIDDSGVVSLCLGEVARQSITALPLKVLVAATFALLMVFSNRR